MGKKLTIFYSWQSDTPSSLNRSFIERALAEALMRLHSDATLEEALRDAAVALDKDTRGIAGSPPIADTILRKIDECSVFVADVTFVGESKSALIEKGREPRQFPNPNVMLEYGYALKRHSHNAIVAVMNAAFGKPDAESLPFDLRHLRWPITYNLHNKSSDKGEQFEALAHNLARAIGSVLSSGLSKDGPVQGTAVKPASNAELLRILASQQKQPEIEILGGRIDLYYGGPGWQVRLEAYITPFDGTVVFPFHKCELSISSGGQILAKCSSVYAAARESLGSGYFQKPVSELRIDTPGRVDISASAPGKPVQGSDFPNELEVTGFFTEARTKSKVSFSCKPFSKSRQDSNGFEWNFSPAKPSG